VVGSAADGKVLIDVTNALDQHRDLAIGFTTSAAEELQKLLPKTRVIKAFNTVFAQNQSTGRLGKEQLSAFIAGNDSNAKKIVMQLARDIGFDSIDVGPLKSADILNPWPS
jgi:predicted dinucleotide-binding enzyme